MGPAKRTGKTKAQVPEAKGSPVHTLPGCGEPAGGVPEAGVENEIGDAAKDGTQEPAQGKGVLGLR